MIVFADVFGHTHAEGIPVRLVVLPRLVILSALRSVHGAGVLCLTFCTISLS